MGIAGKGQFSLNLKQDGGLEILPGFYGDGFLPSPFDTLKGQRTQWFCMSFSYRRAENKTYRSFSEIPNEFEIVPFGRIAFYCLPPTQRKTIDAANLAPRAEWAVNFRLLCYPVCQPKNQNPTIMAIARIDAITPGALSIKSRRAEPNVLPKRVIVFIFFSPCFGHIFSAGSMP